MPHFDGKAIVLTGASSGIGRALALELAMQHARLVLAARDATRLEAVAAECRARGAQALIVPTDVSDYEHCRALVDRAVERFGGLDVLINNAGRAMWCRFDELTEMRVMEDLMRVNYFGSVYCTHHALPHLKRSKGLVVATSSLAGLIGVPLLTGYAASKHAMLGFFDSLRIELQGTGVDVTVLAPDFVQSEILPRAAGPDGQPIQESPLDQSNLLSAEKCARRMAKAMARRRRLLLTSQRSAWARWGRIVAPRVTDWIALRAVGFR
ncbi:MAG TPA: SDR family oxidoreductase [Pirellulales bacterium]|jgi:short-subunit dehydrogenase|nr:SDR family oxidoreductase [Pirellulales bacterium]